MRIAVIHHSFEGNSPDFEQGYMICALARMWREKGHEVIHTFGEEQFEPADVALLHIDLSVVPEAYVRLGRRYPRLLNERLLDIRKRHVSQLSLRERDNYTGPVIVKTDLNHAGVPEKIRLDSTRARHWKIADLFRSKAPPIDTKDYPIYTSLREVPRAYFRDPDYLVEKFLPEKNDDRYFIRQAYFLGEKTISWLIPGSEPVMRWELVTENDVEIPTHPALEAYRRKIGLDYGKIDYVEHGGEVHILDVNKTIGSGECPVTQERLSGAIESCAVV